MSKKTLVSSRTCPVHFGRYLATALLMFGLAPAVWAQPSLVNEWDTTISFTGTGNLPVGNFFAGGAPNSVLIPLSTSLSGSGVYTADDNGAGGFTVNSSFNTIVDVSGLPTYSSFSISQPRVGLDPGIPISTPTTTVTASAAPPFYGLYPPPSGTVYTSEVNVSSYYRYFYATNGNTREFLGVSFSGPVSLTLGGTPTVVATPDGSLPGDDYYTYSYTNSTLMLTETVMGDDPPIDFVGTVQITTVAPATAAPETLTLLDDVLLLSLFAAGVKCLRLKSQAGSPA
jgi:hypothetical protein